MARLGRSYPIKPHINSSFFLFIPKNYTSTLLETITPTDGILKDMIITISETVTNSDIITNAKIALAVLSETISNVDTLFKDTTRSIIESITNNDTIAKLTDKIISETTTIADTITNMQVKLIILYENLTIIEDFRVFLNSRVARWRDKYNESKTQDWVEKQDL